MNLKRVILLIFSVFVLSDAFSQQIEFGGLYSYCCWYEHYRHSYGYTLSYHWNNDYQKRRSVVFSHYMSDKEYIIRDDEWNGGRAITLSRPKTLNQRFAVRYMKTWNVLKKDNMALWLGYAIGMDLLIVHQCHKDLLYRNDTLISHSEWGEGGDKYEGTYVGFLGLGPVFEYEFSPKTLDNLSFSFRFNPEINHMGDFSFGFPSPGCWLNCMVSAKYSLPAKQVQ